MTLFSDNDEEEVFRLALGIDSQGMCLRHPNIRIVSSATTNNNNETNETNESSVVGFEACKICRSELEAGGLKLQRKSMAYSIQAMQALHNDRVKWNNFKQNWGDSNNNNNINEEGEDDDDENDETQQQEVIVNLVEEEEKKDTKSLQEETGETISSSSISLAVEVRDALLRGSQVQQWLLLEKTKEIDQLKKQLEELSMENELLKKHMDDQKQTAEETINELQETVKKQEKTIKKELKLIKSIASQRAVNRSTAKAAQQIESELSNMQQSQSSISILHSSAASLTLSQCSPPQLPKRKASEKEIISSSLSPTQDSKIASPTGPKGPPKLPIRQSSDQLKSPPSSIVPNKITFKRRLQSAPPSCPQRQASEDVNLPLVDLSMTDIDEIQSTTEDTTTAEEIEYEIPMSDMMEHAVADNNGQGRDFVSSQKTTPFQSTASSQEISFFPSESDVAAVVPTTTTTTTCRRNDK